MKINPRQRAGFVLAEVVIALALFGITASAVLAGIAFATRIQQHIRDTKAATQVLVEKMELIRLFRLEHVRAGMPRTFVSGKFTGTAVVEPVPFSTRYSDDMAKVTFTINWDTLGNPRTLSWTTFVARDGLVNYVAP